MLHLAGELLVRVVRLRAGLGSRGEAGWARLIRSTQPQKRLLVLHAPNASRQQLVLHRQSGNHGPHPAVLLTEQILLPDLEPFLAGGQRGLAPLLPGRLRDAVLPAGQLQIGVAKQPRNRAHPALGGPADLAAAAGLRPRFGRLPRSLRAPRDSHLHLGHKTDSARAGFGAITVHNSLRASPSCSESIRPQMLKRRWYARQDSNLRPFAPEANALSS